MQQFRGRLKMKEAGSSQLFLQHAWNAYIFLQHKSSPSRVSHVSCQMSHYCQKGAMILMEYFITVKEDVDSISSVNKFISQ